jgi:glycosyltransferase involved in cell wall biosynthesis
MGLNLNDYAILIPAYNPGVELIDLVQKLVGAGFGRIIVVNDGCDPSYEGIFTEASKVPGLVLLKHPVNMGKGAAIKSGARFIQTDLPDCKGFVTVDADGQHSVEDTLTMLGELNAHPGQLILGRRDFLEKNVPLRSWFGNTLTNKVADICFGLHISDTQTGLRGIGREHIPLLLSIPYDRYEFEMEMLIRFKRSGISFNEVPIQTIYINQNSSSHFDPIKDSLRVYSIMLRALVSRRIL